MELAITTVHLTQYMQNTIMYFEHVNVHEDANEYLKYINETFYIAFHTKSSV